MADSTSMPALLPRSLVPPGLSLQQLLAMVWAWRKVIVISIVTCTVLAGVISKLLPKQYSATSALLIDFQVNNPLSGREFPANLAESYMKTQLDLIGSVQNLRAVVQQLGLTTNEDFISGFAGNGGNDALVDWAASQLYQHLSIDQGTDSRFVYVTAKAKDPALSASIANAVAEQYINLQRQIGLNPAQAREQHYNGQLDKLKADVDAAQKKLTDFRTENDLVDGGGASQAEDDRLLDLNRQLVLAEQDRRAAEARAAKRSDVDDNVLDSKLIQDLKAQIATLEAQLAQQSAVLGERHPDIIALHSQLAALKQRLQQEISSYGQGANADLRAARAREASLRKDIAAQRQTITELRQKQAEAASYERSLDAAQEIYNKALSNADQVLFDAGGASGNVTLSSRATPPQKASSPKTRQNVMLGFVFGAGFGTGLALLLGLLDRRVRCVDDVEREFGIPVLVELVPEVEYRPMRMLARLK